MRTRFAALIGIILILTSAVLPVQAAAGADHGGSTANYIALQQERTLGAVSAKEFRYLGNGWHYKEGSWYYVRSGMAVSGWVKDSGKWYYLGIDGRMKSGWIKDNGKWYYLAANGVMRTGWIKVSGKWYYLAANGAMKTGWVKDGGKWYYLAANGAMKIGWAKVDGKWYYMAANGAMRTSCWIKIGSQRFYLTGSGARATGWRTIQGKRYCFRTNGVLDEQKTKAANESSDQSTAQETSQNTVTATTSTSTKKSAKTKGELVAEYALRFVGNPYVYGGCSLTNGTDCSGFVMLIYRHFGVSLPHYDAAIRTKGKSVASLKEAKAGDIICYYGHVAIYLGDGRIVHASNSRDGIKISERADYRTIASIRRIFD